MSMAEGMRNITENIVAAHNVRVKTLGGLVNQVSQSLAEARQRMSRHAAGRKAMSKGQAAALARFAGDLAGSVGAKLNGFGQELELAAKERKLGAKELKGRLRQEADHLRRSVRQTLTDYDKEHAEMSTALRRGLRGFTRDIAQGVEDWATATHLLMTGCRNDIREASGHWRNMARSFANGGEKKAGAPAMQTGKAAGTAENAVRKNHKKRKDESKGLATWQKKFQP